MGLSCKKFLDVGNPQDKIVARYVYESNASASAVMTGIYYDLVQKGSFTQGQSGISISCGAAADELEVFPTNGLREFYTNNVGVGSGGGFWSSLYKFIYRANAVIEGVSNSNVLSESVRNHLLGEAMFLRAFCYFYLVNLYGDVPLLTKPDYRENQELPRVESSLIYTQILSDLNGAKQLLSENYLDADEISLTSERLRPNRWAAMSLLARVYLYLGDWQNAVTESTEVINNKQLYDTVPLNEVFLKNSKEAIWQLQPIYSNPDAGYFGTFDGRMFVLEMSPNEDENPVWISSILLDSFEPNDKRLNNWINSYTDGSTIYPYCFKYKRNKLGADQNEYLTMFRISEVLLIRSEAKAQLGDVDGAKLDLNIIRNRAGLDPISTMNSDILIGSILHERQLEFCLEWGHRWFDLKRTKSIDKVMMEVSKTKGSVWASYRAFFPLPDRDIRLNPKLKQNDGY